MGNSISQHEIEELGKSLNGPAIKKILIGVLFLGFILLIYKMF
tara:strand:- start:304 stop:432 length:129 start_codon:yes stop_codon:yes gene_type:complete